MKKIIAVILFAFSTPAAFSQNVGIGTPAPTEKLHVAGNIKTDTVKTGGLKITPDAGAGKILTSDAVGNASWKSSSLVTGNIGYGGWGDCAANINISEYQPVADTEGEAEDYFGQSVSISGNYVIVGSFLDDVGLNNNQGSASIYQYNGTSWTLMQKITDPTGATEDKFGWSVSISGNYAVVGVFDDDIGANTDQGSALIYHYDGSSWVLMQRITDPGGSGSDQFGVSVSISGNYIIVGSNLDAVGPNSNQGSATIFRFNGTNWVFMQKIFDPDGAAQDRFGSSIAISGNTAIVGSLGDRIGTNIGQGSASIYRHNGTSWVLAEKIFDLQGAANDNFGSQVSISGGYIIVGTPFSSSGRGSVSIYHNYRNNWILMQKIANPAGTIDDTFGSAVSISGDYAFVGARGDDVGLNSNQGSVRIYRRVGLGWQQLQYITDPGGFANDYFGTSVAVDETTNRFLIGSPWYANGSGSGKVVFGKIN